MYADLYVDTSTELTWKTLYNTIDRVTYDRETKVVELDLETIEYTYEADVLKSIRVKGDCGSYVDFSVTYDWTGLTVVPETVGPKVDVVAIREWTRLALNNIP